MTDEAEGKPLLCVQAYTTEPDSDVSADVPSWRILPGCHQATATADTPREMVTGTLVRVGSLTTEPSGQDPEPDTPTVFSKQSSYGEDLSQATHGAASSSGDRPGGSSEDRSLQSVGRFGQSKPDSLKTTADDHAIKPHDREPKSIVSVCLSRKRFVGIIIIMLIIVVALVVVLALLAALPQDIHASTEVYNVNNDTVLAVQFDRHKYNAVTLKHIRRNIVPTHTVYVYSQNCETLTVYNQTVLRTSNHSINISQHTLVSDPTYLLPGSKMEFNVTILNVPSITAEVYLYIFNDLDILFTYYYEQNLGKNAYKSKVYTHGSGSQSTTTSIQYNVTDKGYWFAAIVSDTLFEMEYSSRFYEVLYNRSKLPEKCVLQDTDSCQVDYSFTFASQKECVLCYVTAPPVTSPDPAHITTTVTRKGETPSFYGVLAILIFFCILSFVIISITCIYSFVPASKGKYSPLP